MMKTKSYRNILVASLLLSLAVFAGCASVNVSNKPRSQPAAVTRVDDARPVADIRAENAQLRARNAELENSHHQWQAAVDREERAKDDLKAQRKRAEDDLKKAKKQAKKS